MSIAPFVLVGDRHRGAWSTYARQRPVAPADRCRRCSWRWSVGRCRSWSISTVPSRRRSAIELGSPGTDGEVSYGLDGLSRRTSRTAGAGRDLHARLRRSAIPASLPLTILGLDGASIDATGTPTWARSMSLGWVVQPTDGPITYLSANPGRRVCGRGRSRSVRARSWRSSSSVEPVRAQTPTGAVRDGAAQLASTSRTGRSGSGGPIEVGLPAAVFLTSKSPCTVEVPGGQRDVHARPRSEAGAQGARRLRISASNSGK